MTERLDLLLFGVTGFTGMHCIPYLVKLTKSKGRNLTWGVAGRSKSKIQEVLKQYSEKLGCDLTHTQIIIADVSDPTSLDLMAKSAKVLVNCCGPYRFYGEEVVKACIKNGTHHVDVSGEPEYMERVELFQNEDAKKSGSYVVSACGFDSIPSDLGIVYMEKKFNGTLNSVCTYVEMHTEKGFENSGSPVANYGTWHSLVYGVSEAANLKGLRKQFSSGGLPKLSPKLEVRKLPHTVPFKKGYVVPFLGADKSVARRTQKYFYDNNSKRPIQVETYMMVKSALYVFLGIVMGALLMLMSKFQFGRKLLLDYPSFFSGGLFSKELPSEEAIEKAHFSITFYGEGWSEKLADVNDVPKTAPNKAIIGQVKGKNPGYGATCVMLVLAGIMILTETDKLPGNRKGGVYTPGAAFAKTNLVEELMENEMVFEVLSEKDI